jgi:hypothetical protein
LSSVKECINYHTGKWGWQQGASGAAALFGGGLVVAMYGAASVVECEAVDTDNEVAQYLYRHD